MRSIGFETNSWIWNGVYYHLHLCGGILVLAVVLGLSTNYFGRIQVLELPRFLPDLVIFCEKKYGKKPIRVYMEGCFDLMHYGHANALRQAKSLGDELVVGVISDEEITASKGPPVLSMEERLVLVKGLKWVDEVIVNAPYTLSEQFMDSLVNEHKIDYLIHGDDPCLLPDGTDAYAIAKKLGRYKQIKRTEGVSSTNIVGRILSSMGAAEDGDNLTNATLPEQPHNLERTEAEERRSSGSQISHFLPTSRRIVQFSNGKEPGLNARVVYIDGAFDLFNAGHVKITTFNISLVVKGTVADNNSLLRGEADRYAVPKSMGIFQMIESPTNITTTLVIKRIIANHEVYKERNAKKAVSEKKYYAEKKFVSGY